MVLDDTDNGKSASRHCNFHKLKQGFEEKQKKRKLATGYTFSISKMTASELKMTQF